MIIRLIGWLMILIPIGIMARLLGYAWIREMNGEIVPKVSTKSMIIAVVIILAGMMFTQYGVPK